MLEIACFTLASAITASQAGAHRLELCASYSLGGTTPSLSTLLSVRKAVPTIPINVMIRPRGGNFVYSAAEFDQMKSEVKMFRDSGAVDGFVFGVLDEGGWVDRVRNVELVELVELAAGLACTFHRAVDETMDIEEAVQTIIECGFKSVLTSGAARTAGEGAERVAELKRRYGGRISFVLGGGVRSKNVLQLKRATGVEWLHSAAIMGDGEEVDGQEVRKMQALLEDA